MFLDCKTVTKKLRRVVDRGDNILLGLL